MQTRAAAATTATSIRCPPCLAVAHPIDDQPRDARPLRCVWVRADPDLGFGRIVASEIEVPNMFVNLV